MYFDVSDDEQRVIWGSENAGENEDILGASTGARVQRCTQVPYYFAWHYFQNGGCQSENRRLSVIEL